ncbi:hypothetical protein TNIN_168691 [Trichonephila inaurata madagascariensis]|uniref:Uncharacterized protein n=1 Tax=Trichonephila inaurata madagascariensis TaxID=2747483 RepID=A0A8X6I6H5_9ARAC|nr:hypothetical protein TNIN_168691 [Trichonephila inaurata madagascariensis]
MNKVAIEVPFQVSNIIAENKKSHEDSEITKTTIFLEVANVFVDSFKNKTGILPAMKSAQLSENTAMKRVELMISDVTSQFYLCSFFSLKLSELTDIVDTAQC